MTIDFSSIRHRLKYCNEEIQQFLDLPLNGPNGPWSIDAIDKDESRSLELYLRIDQDFLFAISMKISNVIHHLRAVLDNTVYLISTELASLQESEMKRIYFPLCDNIEDWKGNPTRNLFKKKIVNKYYQLLLHLQPFASNLSWEDSNQNPLKLLFQLSNQDKHRQLQVSFLKVRELNFEVKFTFPSETETCIPKGIIFEGAFAQGGLLQRFDLECCFESYAIDIGLSTHIWAEGVDMPMQKFLPDCLSVVRDVVENFDRFGEISDWNSSFSE